MAAAAGIPLPPRSRARARRRAGDQRPRRSGWALATPFFVLYFLFLLWPVLAAAWKSLFSDSLAGGDSDVRGLGNYGELLGDGDFWAAMWHTLLFTLLSTPPLVILRAGARAAGQPRREGPVAVPARLLRALRAAGLGRRADLELALPAGLRPHQRLPHRARLRRGQLARRGGHGDDLRRHRHRVVDARLQLRALPRRAAGDPEGALRGRRARRRPAVAADPAHHAAAADADDGAGHRRCRSSRR